MSGIHPTAFLKGGNNWSIYGGELNRQRDFPETWRAQTAQKTELVACIQVEVVLVETCPYKLKNGQAVSVERYQYKTSVALREAQTASVVAETSWQGTEPAKCSTETQFKEGETVKKVYGVATSAGDITDWLRPYIELP